MLIPTDEPNVCVAFADAQLPMDFDFGQFQNFPLLAHEQGEQLGRLVEQAATSANLGLKVAEGALRARGLIRLHPETVNALSTGAQTLQQGGWNIGTFAGTGGKFASTVKWLPAGAGVTALTVASTAGAALALLALQAQLNRIEKVAECALEVASSILDEILADQRNEVAEIVYELRKSMKTARHIGLVTDSVWGRIEKQRFPVDFRRLTRDARRRVQHQQAALRESALARDRAKWFNDNSRDVVQDVVTATQALVGLVLYEGMQLAYESRKYGGDELEEGRIAHDHQQARQEIVEMRKALEPVIAELWRQLSLMIECPGAASWKVWDRKNARADASTRARRLRDSIADIYGGVAGDSLAEPYMPNEFDSELAPLRWLLRPGEQIYLSCDFSTRLRSEWTLIASQQRMFVLKRSDFTKTGHIQEVRENSEIEYRFPESGNRKSVCVYPRGADDTAKPLHEIRFRKEDFPENEVAQLRAALSSLVGEQRDEPHDSAAMSDQTRLVNDP